MEHHIHILCDGKSVHIDGLPGGPDCILLSQSILSGIYMIFSLVEARVNSVSCISISGICFTGQDPQICAYDIWVQCRKEGFYLPMALCAKLFSENGIPYFHPPVMP